MGAMAPSINQRSEARGLRSEKTDSGSKAATYDVFAKPLTEKATTSLPGPVPAAAPEPFTPPVVVDISATLTATLVPGAGGDVDSDGKADPGDTINYSATLTSSGAGGTGLSLSNPLDSHTTLVPGTLNSTPVAFDQSVTTNEDTALSITIQGQDPDGSNLTFTNISSPANGSLGSFSAPSCNGAGICSSSATFTPNANFFGSTSFTFKVSDGTAASNETGLVYITVNGVNDAPTFTVPGNPAAVNEDAGATTVTNFVTGIRPAQSGNSTEDTQTVSLVITNVTHSALFSSQPALTVANGGNQPFPLNANLTYTPAANANGTSVVTYHLHDNGGTANSGVDNSADQTFTITVNAVNDAPVVQAKAFTVQANMKITGLTGLLTGVTDADATNANADALSQDKAANYTSPNVTLTSVTGACTALASPCTISNVQTNGTFDFDPTPGVTGTITLNYTVTDTGNPGPGVVSAAGTITITVNGPVIWFVDTSLGAAGTGRLSAPFNTLAAATTAMCVNAAQRIFVFGASNTAVGTTVTLQGNNSQATQPLAQAQAQWLIGQAVSAASFDTFFGITPPAGTIARPSVGGSRPTIRGTVTMKENTMVQGLNIDTSAGATKGLTASALTAGASGSILLIKDVNVTSAGGNAVDLSAASFNASNQVEYTTSNAGTSPNILISTGGIALNVVNLGITANGLNFKSISANGGTNGIVLNTTGTGALNVTGTGTTGGSGGTIQNTTKNGIELRTAQNITLKNMNVSGNGTAQTVAGSASSCSGDLATGNNLSCVANIFMQAVTTASFDRLQVLNSGQQGINGNAVNGLSITNSTITGNGNEGFENGILLQNQSGTTTIQDNTIQDNRARQIHIGNGSGSMTLNIGGTASNSLIGRTVTPANADAQQGVLLQLQGTSNSTVNASKLTINNSVFNFGGLVYENAFQINADNGNPVVNGSIQNSSFDRYAAAVFVNGGGTTTTVNFDIKNNATMTHSNLQAINLTVLGGGAGIKPIVTSTIFNNTINGCEPVGANCHAIDFNAGENHNGEFHVLVDNNTITGVGSGIVMLAGGAATAGLGAKAHLKIIRNNLSAPGFANGRSAIELQAALTSTNPNILVCTDVGGSGVGNTISGAWAQSSNQSGIFLRQRFSAANSWVLPGYGGPANNSGGQVETYLNGRNTNTATPFVSTATTTTGAYVTGSCTTPLQLGVGGVESQLESVFADGLDPNSGSAQSGFLTRINELRFYGADAVKARSNETVPALLDQSQLDAVVAAAASRWTATGLTAQQIAILNGLKFE